MALYAGLRSPGVLGHVLSQSGAFSLFDRDTVVSSLVEHSPVPSLKIWMDVGTFEYLLASNRRLHGQLTKRG